jgi:hypothetical protein
MLRSCIIFRLTSLKMFRASGRSVNNDGESGGHVKCLRGIKNAYSILVGKFEDLCLDGRIESNYMLKNTGVEI